MSELTIDAATTPQATILTLRGPGDMAAVALLERRLTVLTAQHPGHVILDLSGLELISSLFMGVLVQFHHGLKRRGGRLLLAAATELVSTALRRARLHDLLSMYNSLDDALKSIPADAASQS